MVVCCDLCRLTSFPSFPFTVRTPRHSAFFARDRGTIARYGKAHMMKLLSSMFGLRNTEDIFSLALWLAGIGHFCVLIASFQVPSRLHWSEDLKKLTSFNRKLMWVHGAFAVLTIIAFGTLTMGLHSEMLRGDRAALGVALFIGVYWALRISVDFFYYDHEDWPSGRGLIAGHILLTLLFAYLAATNLGLVVWKMWVR